MSKPKRSAVSKAPTPLYEVSSKRQSTTPPPSNRESDIEQIVSLVIERMRDRIDPSAVLVPPASLSDNDIRYGATYYTELTRNQFAPVEVVDKGRFEKSGMLYKVKRKDKDQEKMKGPALFRKAHELFARIPSQSQRRPRSLKPRS